MNIFEKKYYFIYEQIPPAGLNFLDQLIIYVGFPPFLMTVY